MLFCHIESHVATDPDPGLMQEKGGTGFPSIAFLGADGKVVAQQRGRSVDEFADTLANQVKDWFELVDLAATGDPDAQKRLLLKKVELAHFADVERARDALNANQDLTEAERAAVEQQLVDQEFGQILATVRSAADAGRAGALARPMFDKGRVPKSGSLPMYYWLFLGKHAAESADVELLTKAIDALEELPRRVSRVYMTPLREALEKLQNKKG